MPTRGIVICPPFKFDKGSDGGGSFAFQQTDPVDLREYALYWDVIDLPNQNLVGITPSPEDDFALLEQEGVFIRSHVELGGFSGSIALMGVSFIVAQTIAAERHNAEGGAWAIGQNSANLVLPAAVSHEARVAEVSLYKSVPVPLAEVPIEQVLEFKSRRRDELDQYRFVLDSLYQDIASSGDVTRAKSYAVDKIQNSILDLNRVMGESALKRRLRSVRVELNLSDLIKDAIIGGAASFAFGIPPAVGTGVALAASAINIGVGVAPKLNSVPDHLRDYAYVFAAQEEFGA
ncbi:DUF6236 family protein [Rubrivirga litoralis]|uniref:DUF6236 family protein n=1 Tax=Rubrivirga litoralis TaxID=3075598 RepID=A0ABU3BTA1_9BACT|nr:DUF6236 family protein [Rubrivirga sp. F394]MDT0632514.1 DUF6236 family protein [Rubrivirga sp. F394]